MTALEALEEKARSEEGSTVITMCNNLYPVDMVN
jgi:hypothetical protein